MATFHIDRDALQFKPETVQSLQQAFKLPKNICQAHIRATEIGNGMREQLRHATEGLTLIHELDDFEDETQEQMITALRKSLEAVATELSIKLYEKMPKTPIAWADACRIVTEIFDRELGSGFITPNGVDGFESDSAVVADALLSSDAQGHFSHGVERIIRYILLMRAGKLNPKGECRWTEEFDHMGRFDGGCTFGQVGMEWGLQKGIERAKERGSYLIAGSNMGHVGRLAYSIQKALREQLLVIGMLNTNGGRAAVEMNGIEALLGTNPFGMGVPDGHEGVLLDFATTKQPEGAINVMLQQGLVAPYGLLREPDGSFTTNPHRLYEVPIALLTAMGDHKGLALAQMADLTTAALTGQGRTGKGKQKTSPNGVNNGWLFLHRVEGKAHHQIIDAYAEMVAKAKVLKGTKRRGVLPGVRGQRAEVRARAGNVLIPKEVWKTVTEFHKTNKLPEVKM